MNRASLEESRRAIEQAEKVKRLTLLAFFFVPLSFTASIFGMNFKEFGQGHLSIYIFGIVVGPVFGLSAVVGFWDSFSIWLKSFWA